MDKVHEVIRNPTKMSKLLAKDDLPSFVQDKMARTYASWLLWWKSTITSDDYMKYLSTQVLFKHLKVLNRNFMFQFVMQYVTLR